MKRENIMHANVIDSQLMEAERRLVFFRTVEKLNISSACCYELQDYPEPSEIGAAFREVRAALVKLFEAQCATLKQELADLGVN